MISEPEVDEWWQSLPYKAKVALKEFVDGVDKGLKKMHKETLEEKKERLKKDGIRVFTHTETLD